MPSTISIGSTGDDVKRLQRALARPPVWLRIFGPITGIFDAGLQTAVQEFQQANGLTPDGVVGPETWAALPSYMEASPTLQLGSTGPVVAWLQQKLSPGNLNNSIQFAFYTGAIDGIFGPQTQAAVQSLQAAAGVAADGIVTDDTWFIWMAPGTLNQSTLEGECGLYVSVPQMTAEKPLTAL